MGQNALFHLAGLKVVNHFCGGLMPMLELVVESGADGLETMTPPAMGGDCDLREASRRVGARLFFLGGFDQNAGFESGTPAAARRLVFECFEATRDHAGYILCPSDHFFRGDPACLQAFADAYNQMVPAVRGYTTQAVRGGAGTGGTLGVQGSKNAGSTPDSK